MFKILLSLYHKPILTFSLYNILYSPYLSSFFTKKYLLRTSAPNEKMGTPELKNLKYVKYLRHMSVQLLFHSIYQNQNLFSEEKILVYYILYWILTLINFLIKDMNRHHSRFL